jgi:hypothetical protein
MNTQIPISKRSSVAPIASHGVGAWEYMEGEGDHWQIISGTDLSILKRGESARIPSVSFAVSLCIDRGGG